MSGFLTLTAASDHREDVRNSIFLAHAARADSPEDALAALRAFAARHADASHLCWAYRIGPQYRFSDGGEPGGTAGQPIFRAIEGQGLDHVVVGVIRYFGGTKLGAGGLMRAYGGVAAEALRLAGKTMETPRAEWVVRVPFSCLGVLYHALELVDVREREESFDEAGVSLRIRIPEDRADRLASLLRDATRDEFAMHRGAD